MQNKTTLLKLLSINRKMLTIFGMVFFILGNLNAQVVSTASGTNYLGNFSINNPAPLAISFVVENTTAVPVALTNVSTQLNPIFTAIAGSPSNIRLFYSATSLSDVFDISTAAWAQIASGTATVPASLTVVPITIPCLNFIIPANTQYRFVLEVSTGLSFSFSPTPTPNSFSVGGINLKVGTASIGSGVVGYAAVSPASPAGNAGAFFGGSVTLVPGAACTGTPTPGNTITSAASVCPGTPFSLSVQNCTPGSGITYEWQSSATLGGTYTPIAGGTNSTLGVANLAANTFYRAKVTCAGNAGFSNPVQVSLNPPSGCYCIPTVIDCSLDDNISSVVFAGINNVQATPCLNGSGYTNYTALAPANVLQTATYPISVTVGPGGTEYVGVWIDYNQNGTFDASEFKLLGSANGATISSTINIPPTATVGSTRMRIRVQYNTPVTSADACSQTSSFGEVEDYRVNISAPPPCSGTPAPGNTISTVTNICSAVPFDLRIQNIVIAAGLSYQWQTSPNVSGPWTNVGPNLPLYNGVTQTASTYYRCSVTCGANTGTSTPVQVIQNATNQCYCASTPSSNADEDIFNVTVGTLNSSSTCATLAPGLGSVKNLYSNYANTATGAISAPATDLLSGAANPFSVSTGTCGGNFSNSVAVWIDYNQDGVFSTTERVYASPSGTTGPHTETGNLVIPATALLGPTRMRVINSETGTATSIPPCGLYGAFSWGETEDYIVNIVPCVPVTITAPLANASVACGSTASFAVQASGSLPTYQWQYRISATAPWLAVPNAAPYSAVNTSTLSIAADGSLNGYQYRAFVTGACSATDVTTVATLTVTTIALAIAPATINKCLAAAPVLITAPSTQSVLSFTNSTPGVVADGDLVGISRSVTVSGVTGPIQKVRVKMNALSSWIGDLVISLKAPNGQIINLDYLLNRTNNGPSGTSGNPPGPSDGFINTIFNLNRVLRGTPSTTGGVLSPAAQGIDQFNSPYTAEYPIDNQQALFFVGVPSGPTGFAATTNNVGTFYAHSPVTAANGVWTLAMYDAGPPDPAAFKDFTLEITYGGAPATFVMTPTTGLFTNAAGTTAYTGTAVTQVYAAPLATATYGAVITAGLCSTGSQAINVTVNSPAAGTATLKDTTICANKNASFTLGTAALTGGPTFTHQYQVKPTGASTWTDITNGGVYSGATTATLTLTNVPDSYNGNVYRDSINTFNSCGSLISTSAKLFVNTTPVVTISAAPVTKLFPSLTSTLTAAVSSAAAPLMYQWNRNGIAVAGATNNTTVVTIDGLGVYTVAVKDNNGCTSAGVSTPASIAITDSVTTAGRLFIYPSPNNGQFQVRYFNFGNAPTFVNVFDNKGALVFSKPFSVGTAYQSMNVDLGVHAGGIYRIDVVTNTGARINTGSVMVY